MHHHGTVALLSRCEEIGLVERRKSNADRRQVEIHLLVKGKRCLECLATMHESELRSLQDTFQVARITALNNEENQHS